MEKVIECVANVSEGRNQEKIAAMAQCIQQVKGCYLLHQDSGEAAHRTVFTFAGECQAVFEAAFQLFAYCQKNIDMRLHAGKHPRLGAVDVCPFVPIRGIELSELVPMVDQFMQRLGDELNISGFGYEMNAKKPGYQSLAQARKGQYEALPLRLEEENFDFGPSEFNPKFGASIVGARDFLLAFNVNLNTTDAVLAQKIAEVVRTSGRLNDQGERVPGKLKNLRCIGWYIDEYQLAQVSCNLLDYRNTPAHVVYETIKEEARNFGVEVTGAELIGLAPAQALAMSGLHYTEDPNSTADELVRAAIQYMNLHEINTWEPRERVLEWALMDKSLVS